MSKELATYLLPFLIPVLGGLLGTLLEAAGARFKIPALVALGQRIEGILVDLPKAIRGSRKTAEENAEPKDPTAKPPSVKVDGKGLTMTAIAFVLAFGVGFASLVSCTSQQVPNAADAYARLVQVCQLYAFVPADHHTAESDKACQAVTHLCDEATPAPTPAPTSSKAPAFEDAGVPPSVPVDTDAGQ